MTDRPLLVSGFGRLPNAGDGSVGGWCLVAEGLVRTWWE
jgi:hypothetical protein